MSAKAAAGPDRWHRLDNTANLFPVIASQRATNVYRLSVNLTEPVTPELLQRALETALPWFAAFRVRLRKGFFWYYLEHNPATPQVQPEDDYPCRYIDPAKNNGFMFRVSYFEHRINLEVFHVLTDGTGGYAFLQAIICQYLMLAHPDAFSAEDKQKHWFTGHAADTEDSYVANYTPTKKTTFKEGKAYLIKGERDLLGNMSVVHIHIGLPGLKKLAKEKNATITQYLLTCMGQVVLKSKRGAGQKRPVNIFTPVNLRTLFESNTSLNFFSNVHIQFFPEDVMLEFDELLANVKDQFEKKVNKEYMLERISYTVGSGYSPLARALPLPLKTLGLRLIYEASTKSNTMGFSNMGRVVFPAPFVPYIAGASLLLSISEGEPFKVTAVSYGGDFVLSVTNSLKSTTLQRDLVRKLAADGLDITIETNGVDYGSM